MPYSSSVSRLTQALAGAERHWQHRHQEAGGGETAVTSPYTITLAREAGTPGTSIAHEVGTRLGWPVYDHELLERIAQEMGLRVKLLEHIDERRQSWLRECLESFATVPSVSESAYVRHLIETVLALGTHGGCVIVGRGATYMLPAETTLRVRLVAPVEDRIKAMSQTLGLSRQQAAQKVQETDAERVAFVKQHFRKDPADPQHYDVLLNAARWSVAECAELIVEALRRMQERTL